MPCRPTEVQRCVERDQVRVGPPGHRQARRRRGRDHHFPVGTAAGHLAHQGPQQQDLADADRVKPETGLVADSPWSRSPRTFRSTLRDTYPPEAIDRRAEERRSPRRPSKSHSARMASRGILSRNGALPLTQDLGRSSNCRALSSRRLATKRSLHGGRRHPARTRRSSEASPRRAVPVTHVRHDRSCRHCRSHIGDHDRFVARLMALIV